MLHIIRSSCRKANDLLLQGGDSTHRGLQLFDLEWTNIQRGQNWTATNADEDLEAARDMQQLRRDRKHSEFEASSAGECEMASSSSIAARRIESKEA